MLDVLIGTSVLLPFAAAVLCYFTGNGRVRGYAVMATGVILVATSLLTYHHGPFSYTPESILGIDVNYLITASSGSPQRRRA